jgi:hypothetical protein
MKLFLYLFLCTGLSLTFVNDSYAKSKKKMKEEKSFERLYGMAGCGWGSLVQGPDGGQVSAATTNGTLGNQTFGISFGTANCIDDEAAESSANIDNFIRGNNIALADDIARGNGETLVAFGNVMGCSNTQKLGQSLQANFKEIYGNGTKSTMKVTDSVINVIINDKDLEANCSRLKITM